MIRNTNYGELYNRFQEIRNFSLRYPTIGYWMDKHMNHPWERFRAANEIFLSAINRKEELLIEAHVSWQAGADGKPEYKMTATGEYIFKSEVDKLQFNEAWAEFMKTPCTIHI